MTSDPDINHSNRLTDLAERIKLADAAMTAAAKEMGAKALESGDLLLQAKAECPHGEWLRFLEKAGVAERQAQRLMTIARSGLESDTVSDLGIRGSLTLASQRRLPSSGSVLVACVGDALTADWPLALPGQFTAWVFEARGRPGFWHVVGMSDYEKGSLASWTKKPFPRCEERAIFVTIDIILNGRQSETSFRVVDLIEDGLLVPHFLRDGFMEDAAEEAPHGTAR